MQDIPKNQQIAEQQQQIKLQEHQVILSDQINQNKQVNILKIQLNQINHNQNDIKDNLLKQDQIQLSQKKQKNNQQIKVNLQIINNQFKKQQKIHKQNESKISIISQQIKQTQKQLQQIIKQTDKKNQQDFDRPISIKKDVKTLDIEQTQSIQKKQQQICLQVINQVQKSSTILKYSLFVISGYDMHGRVDIMRKYSQFQSLRKILLERWPGCYIPSLSDKCDIKNAREKDLFKFRWLTHFLMGLAQSPFMYYKQQVQLFLRTDLDIKQMFDQMPSLKVPDVIDRFKNSFGENLQKPSITNDAVGISTFSTSLKKIFNNLGDLSKQCLILGQSYENYSMNILKFEQFVRSYQHFQLAQFTDSNRDKTIIVRDGINHIDKLKALLQSNPFYQLYQLIQIQAKDAQSMCQILSASQMFTTKRDELQFKSKQTQLQIDQIALGHKSLKIMTSRKNKQQIQAQLQQKQKQYIAQKILVIELYSIIQKILSQHTIKTYKKFKIDSYQNIIREWVKLVGNNNIQLNSLWKFIQEDAKAQIIKA